jgi:hypothetical protein
MKYGFYFKNSKKQEIIGKTEDLSRLSAAMYFAKMKNLPLKEFLKVFGVKTILR